MRISTQKFNFVQTLLDNPTIKLMYKDYSSSATTFKSRSPLIQNADLKELRDYFDCTDSTEFLGNLYRIIIHDGYIRWICQKDYNTISLNKRITDFIKQIENINGKFNQENKQLTFNQLKLTSGNSKIQF